MQKTNGKVILVTGGAQGLGKAICATLAAEHTVIIGDVQEDKTVMLAKQLQENNGNAYPLRLDVGNEDSVKEVMREITEKFGRLDALINNAGVDFTKPIMEMTAAEWDLVMTVNLRGPFLTSKYALPLMAQQGSGHIINVVSTASLRAWPEASAYHASKWGLRGFTQALFTEARRHNIKVTAVIAGGMKTPFLLDRFPDIDQ